MARVRILVTNDDGIESIGLHILARAMRPFGEVVIVAPDREFSGASAAVGALHELRPEVRRCHVEGIDHSWSVSGPPALCVMFSRLGAFGGPFDLVVSGINPGANVGRAVYHSGTVGAAITARNGGISGVAVSQSVDGSVEGQGWDEMLIGLKWDTAAHVAASYVGSLVANMPASPVVANINVPNMDIGDLAGWRHADIGSEPPNKVATARLEPRIGQPNVYNIEMSWGPSGLLNSGTDGRLLQDGYVSLTYVSRYSAEHRDDMAMVESGFMSQIGAGVSE